MFIRSALFARHCRATVSRESSCPIPESWSGTRGGKPHPLLFIPFQEAPQALWVRAGFLSSIDVVF
jgi:hypothetical protein